jgi:hypothetical protein
MAKENRSWGYDRIPGVLANLSPGFGSNGRQCTVASRHTAGAGAQANDHLGRIHSGSPRGAGGH